MLKFNKSFTAKREKGQSTIEYIILVALILSALLIFMPTFKTAYNQTLQAGTNGMQSKAQALSNSHVTP